MGRRDASRWCALLIGLGLYLTCRGYHSRDGDQAYRLPLLLRQQDARLYVDDPFVRSFDAFNPHRGFLALVEAASRPLGLSAGLFGLFAACFAVTAVGIDRLARAVWPAGGAAVGVLAAGLVFAAKAGNIGTNHLFEAMLLDRLVALGLGWVALAEIVARPGRAVASVPGLIGLAALVHPSVGLQLALWIGATAALAVACRRTGEVRPARVGLGLGLLGLAMIPAMLRTGAEATALLRGMDPADYLVLTAQVQSPQHMLPHLWRMPQWLAAGCFLALAALTLAESRPWPPARSRLVVLLGVNLLGLAAAWVAVEGLHDLRATIFQPFRMATPARGLCLVVIGGRVLRLWREGGAWERGRALMLAVGLTGDWSFVAVAAVELVESLGRVVGGERWGPGAGLLALAVGLWYLAGHDTESGQLRLVGALGAGWIASRWAGRGSIAWTWGRTARVTALAWAVPVAAVVLPLAYGTRAPEIVERLAEHCRFGERPGDEVERLAVWCRDHTPESAVFVGPPGPKTFRLWSRRALAFNRAGSPYHAAGLADWAARFQDHVGFAGSAAAFARAYLDDRQALEHGFDAMTPAELADLAGRQRAAFVLASSRFFDMAGGPLEPLRRDGRYAVYRVRATERAPAIAGRSGLRPAIGGR